MTPRTDTAQSCLPAMAGKLKILVADDHAVLREGIALLINREADMQVVAQASGGREAVDLAREHHPDIAILDLSMPDMGGMEVARLLRESCPEVRMAVLTRHADAGFLDKVWSIGARAYVLKRSAAQDLVTALRAVARGNSYIDPDLADRFRENVIGRRKHGQDRVSLTGRETDVLSLVAWGYSNSEIALRLDISVKTVEFYRACAVEKLGLRGRSAIVRYALQQGWINDDNAPE